MDNDDTDSDTPVEFQLDPIKEFVASSQEKVKIVVNNLIPHGQSTIQQESDDKEPVSIVAPHVLTAAGVLYKTSNLYMFVKGLRIHDVIPKDEDQILLAPPNHSRSDDMMKFFLHMTRKMGLKGQYKVQVFQASDSFGRFNWLTFLVAIWNFFAAVEPHIGGLVACWEAIKEINEMCPLRLDRAEFEALYANDTKEKMYISSASADCYAPHGIGSTYTEHDNKALDAKNDIVIIRTNRHPEDYTEQKFVVPDTARAIREILWEAEASEEYGNEEEQFDGFALEEETIATKMTSYSHAKYAPGNCQSDEVIKGCLSALDSLVTESQSTGVFGGEVNQMGMMLIVKKGTFPSNYNGEENMAKAKEFVDLISRVLKHYVGGVDHYSIELVSSGVHLQVYKDQTLTHSIKAMVSFPGDQRVEPGAYPAAANADNDEKLPARNT